MIIGDGLAHRGIFGEHPNAFVVGAHAQLAREQHMPKLATPRSFDFLILKSPGSTAPIVATGTLIPAVMFGAPHTICTGSSAPTFTVTTCMWSESG